MKIENKLKESIHDINTETRSIITLHWKKLIILANELIEKETLYLDDIKRILD